jgi:hypothetical protein
LAGAWRFVGFLLVANVVRVGRDLLFESFEFGLDAVSFGGLV